MKKNFNRYKAYILLLKTSTGQLLIDSRKKTGFIGFLICIESVLTLYEELCKTDVMKYIALYKLDEDHLELLFGCIRQHGGSNNNPNVRQFKAAMKKILVHADVRSINSGNCISLEEISILHISSARKITNSEDVINSTTTFGIYDDLNEDNYNEYDDLTNLINTHSYVSDVRQISEFSINIVEYIAGYIVMQLKKKLHCEYCVNVLILKSSEDKNNLISIKNRGGLIQPSEDVITICRKCEIDIRYIIHKSNRVSISEFN